MKNETVKRNPANNILKQIMWKQCRSNKQQE